MKTMFRMVRRRKTSPIGTTATSTWARTKTVCGDFSRPAVLPSAEPSPVKQHPVPQHDAEDQLIARKNAEQLAHQRDLGQEGRDAQTADGHREVDSAPQCPAPDSFACKHSAVTDNGLALECLDLKDQDFRVAVVSMRPVRVPLFPPPDG